MNAFAAVIRHERRAAFADRALLVSLLAFLLLAVYALVCGADWMRSRNAEAALAHSRTAERNAEFATHLALYESGQGAKLGKPAWYPGWITRPTTPDARPVLPALPLAAMAANAGDLQPHVAHLRAASSRYSLFDDASASTQNPVSLLAGRFDITFLLTAVLPLLLLAFSYDLLSGELERGTLALVMAQPVRLAQVIAGKLLVRGVLIVLPVLAIVLGGLGWAGGVPSSARHWLDFGVLAVLIVSYSAFWLLLAALINAHGRSSPANALALGGLWLVLVVVVPSLLNVAITTFYPPPDRAELTNTLRSTLVDARKGGEELVGNFNLQHPELAGSGASGAVEAWDSSKATLKTWLVRERADALVAPVASAFEERLDAQQRLAERTRFLSPALVFTSALNRLAGTDATRTREFRQAVRAHLDDFRALLVPRIVAGQPIASGDFARLPAFAMAAPARAQGLFADWIGIVVPAFAIALLAAAGVRRYRVGERR